MILPVDIIHGAKSCTQPGAVVARTIVVNWPPAQVYGDLCVDVAPWPDILDVSFKLTMLHKSH